MPGHSVLRTGRWQWALVFALALDFALALGASPAVAQTLLRCDNGTVSLGADIFQVGRACGAADSVTRSLVERGIAIDNRGQAAIGAVLTERRVIEVERWHYAGSRGRLSRTLLFEDGVLIDLRMGGYGR
jgi:hypothetical protein